MSNSIQDLYLEPEFCSVLLHSNPNSQQILLSALTGSFLSVNKLQEKHSNFLPVYYRALNLVCKIDILSRKSLLEIDKYNLKQNIHFEQVLGLTLNDRTIAISKKIIELCILVQACFSYKNLLFQTILDDSRLLNEQEVSKFPNEIKALHNEILTTEISLYTPFSYYLYSTNSSVSKNENIDYTSCTAYYSDVFSFSELSLNTRDYVNINGILIEHKTPIPLKRQYIVYVHPQNKHFVEDMPRLARLAKRTRKNILCLNLRNNSYLTHLTAINKQDFMLDAEAGIDYLLSIGVANEDVTLCANGLHCPWSMELALNLDGTSHECNIFFKAKKYTLLEIACMFILFGWLKYTSQYLSINSKLRSFTLEDIRNYKIVKVKLDLSSQESSDFNKDDLLGSGGGLRFGTKHLRKKRLYNKKINAAKRSRASKSAKKT